MSLRRRLARQSRISTDPGLAYTTMIMNGTFLQDTCMMVMAELVQSGFGHSSMILWRVLTACILSRQMLPGDSIYAHAMQDTPTQLESRACLSTRHIRSGLHLACIGAPDLFVFFVFVAQRLRHHVTEVSRGTVGRRCGRPWCTGPLAFR